MSEIAKLLAASSLLAAGFFGASMFGPPSAGDANQAEDGSQPQPLQPLDIEPLTLEQPPGATALVQQESIQQASHWENSGFPSAAANEHRVARPPISAPSAAAPAKSAVFTIPSISKSSTQPSAFVPSTSDSASRLAALEPPPLLDAGIQAAPLRKSTFPQQPVAPAPMPSAGFAAPTPASQWPETNSNTSTASNLPPSTFANFGLGLRDQDGNEVLHIVRDGDSLAKLAERYLGSAERAREIYDLNRDIVEHPDLLKIGVQLRIPERQGCFINNGTVAPSVPENGLAPLPELPANLQAAPRARLLAPVPASVASGG